MIRIPRPCGLFALALAAGAFAPSCADEPLGTTPPAAIDPTGVWTGTWTEDVHEDPRSGMLAFSFVTDEHGRVEGTSGFGGIDCLGTYDFAGLVAGLAMQGSSTQEELLVTYEFDLREVVPAIEGTPPSIRGSFHVDLGGDCAGLQADFQLGLQIVPGDPTAPMPLRLDRGGEASAIAAAFPVRAAKSSGRADEGTPASENRCAPIAHAILDFDFAGTWCERARDAEAPRVELLLEPTPGGALVGRFALDGRPFAFAGRAFGLAIAGLAYDGRSGLALGARALEADRIALRIEPGAPRVPFELEVQRVPRDAVDGSSSNTIGSFAGR